MPVAVINNAHWNPSGYAGPATTGYQNHPSWPGSFTGGLDTSGSTVVTSGSTVNFVDYTQGVLVGNSGTTATGATFNGCRFRFSAGVNNVTGDASSAQVLLFADDVTFNYCTFQPDTSNYAAELTGDEISGTRSTYVEYGKSYQYALEGGGGFGTHIGKLTVNHCDFWGFGNAMELSGSTLAKPHVVQHSWFHHGGDPFIENTSHTFHNDCWLVNGNGGSYVGAQALYNRMEIWGNTNLIAWQQDAGTPGTYSDCTVVGNLFGGDQISVTMGEGRTTPGARMTFTDNWFATRIGRAVGSGQPLYTWDVSDSGSGSLWRRNRYLITPGSASANYPGANWGNTAHDQLYWHPSDGDSFIRAGSAHASDYTG